MRRLAARAQTQAGLAAARHIHKILETGAFVDIYKLVRGSLRVGEPSYSIKYLERLADIFREDATQSSEEANCQDAQSSIALYFNYLASKEQALLDEIEQYNAQDCESLLRFTEWLRALQVREGLEWDKPLVNDPEEDDLTEEEKEEKDAIRLLAPGSCGRGLGAKMSDTHVILRAEEVAALLLDGNAEGKALGQLLAFHAKESMPSKSQFLGRIREHDTSLLFGDDECISIATLVESEELDASPKSKSPPAFLVTYRFDPQQPCGFKVGDTVAMKIGADIVSWGNVVELSHGTIALKVRKPTPDAVSLVRYSEICPAVMRASLLRQAEDIVMDNVGSNSGSAVRRYLRREKPQLLCGAQAELQSLTDVLEDLKASTVVIQGPPGSGKTELSSKLIQSLTSQGKTVAVSSNSHASINNLLCRVHNLIAAPVAKIGETPENSFLLKWSALRPSNIGSALEKKVSLVGATSYPLSRPESEERFDFLFVDEAGQVPVANFVAMAPCARNYILVGDQQQLDMPLQAAHEGISALSCLEYTIGKGLPVVPSDIGLFLGVSYRMNPVLCDFISRAFYEGCLKSYPAASKNVIEIQGSASGLVKKSHGLQFISRDDALPKVVPQQARLKNLLVEDSVQQSDSEVLIVQSIMNQLVGVPFSTSRQTGVLDLESILVVTPYNMQVDALRKTLGVGARVGTVDKFQVSNAEHFLVMACSHVSFPNQGQQAPVVIVSLCGVETDSQESADQALEEKDDRGLANNLSNLSKIRGTNQHFSAPAIRYRIRSPQEPVECCNLEGRMPGHSRRK